jgi:glucosyl-dolichyl phosphate glucuronosyltransferase
VSERSNRVEGQSAETVSVIVCAYTERRWEDLMAAHASLAAQTRSPDQVVLVVDHNDALLRWARAALPGSTVTANVGTPGLSGARNTGVEVASGEVLLFLDDDAVAGPCWVQRMLEPFADPEVLGVGGWADPRWEHPGRPAWFPEPFLWVVGCSYAGLPTSIADVRNPLGCAMGFRRSAFDLVGGFSGLVGRMGVRPVGCEETEFAIRVLQAKPGARIVHNPSARVAHHVTPDRARLSYFLRRCYHEGRSKAVLSASVGATDSLASAARGVRRTVMTGRLAGVASSLAIFAGLTAAAAGYGLARARQRTRGRRAAQAVEAAG